MLLEQLPLDDMFSDMPAVADFDTAVHEATYGDCVELQHLKDLQAARDDWGDTGLAKVLVGKLQADAREHGPK